MNWTTKFYFSWPKY